MREQADEIAAWEGAGLQSVTLGEAYSFDCVSQLGYLAACTTSVELATGILPLDTRTPTLLGMTAAGLDYASEGRFRLGLGASGPQVVSGFHGLPFEGSLGKIRETIAICRTLLRREPVVHHGRWYDVPLGDARPLKLINKPVRPTVPISVAALGERTVALTAEVADLWEPIFYYPERAGDVWADALASGAAKRDAGLGRLGLVLRTPTVVLRAGEDPTPWLDAARPDLALYVGGMGSREQNFYNTLAGRYGFASEAATIQDLFLAGRHAEAAAAVPDELVRGTSLIGEQAWIRDRLALMAEHHVDVLNVAPLRQGTKERLTTITAIRSLMDQ